MDWLAFCRQLTPTLEDNTAFPPGVERDALELEKVEVAQIIKREGMGSRF
jgi:hypothetical protein